MWLLLAALTALFTSLTDVLGRKIIHDVDVVIVAWAWAFFSLPVLYLLVVLQPQVVLGPSFFPALVTSTGLLTCANALYFKAIKVSDLSLTVPMLAFTPLFLLLTSYVMLNEIPRPLGIVGVLFIVGGAYLLHIRERHQGCWAPFKKLWKIPGPRYMLTVAFLYSIGANVDKIGVRNSSALVWGASINTALAVSLGLIASKRSRRFFRQVRRSWVFLSLMGLTVALSVICQMNAIRMTLVPYVIAVKRTSIVMTSLVGFAFFKEGGFPERLAGVLLMIFGVILIYLFQ